MAVNSATSALHLACLSLGLGKGDILWTSPISFVASANAGLYCGALVDFVDIDIDTNNMSISKLREKLIKAKKTGALPKIVMPVHIGGFSCDMESIHRLSKEFGFKIIEDASHAIGGKYRGKPVGSCEFSDVTVFSFHPVKIITTGEGGAAVTNDINTFKSLNTLRTHGITRDQQYFRNKSEGDWYYEQINLGFNYRMTEMQAALGCSQMTRLDEFVSMRNENAKLYREALAELDIMLPIVKSEVYSSYHLFVIKLNSRSPSRRKLIFDYMRKNGIGVNVHYIPIHLQPYYRKLGFNLGCFVNSEIYYDCAISIPLYSHITQADINKVVKTLAAALQLPYEN